MTTTPPEPKTSFPRLAGPLHRTFVERITVSAADRFGRKVSGTLESRAPSSQCLSGSLTMILDDVWAEIQDLDCCRRFCSIMLESQLLRLHHLDSESLALKALCMSFDILHTHMLVAVHAASSNSERLHLCLFHERLAHMRFSHFWPGEHSVYLLGFMERKCFEIGTPLLSTKQTEWYYSSETGLSHSTTSSVAPSRPLCCP